MLTEPGDIGILFVEKGRILEVPMNKIVKILLTLLLMAAVFAYTVYNYTIGRTNQGTFLVYVAILLIPSVNLVNILIQELKNR